jgi:multimeric flavodoxin WrbA
MIIVLNGSLNPQQGNTAVLLERLISHLRLKTEVSVFNLKDRAPGRDELEKSKGFVFASGTYWDSWGSPLQKFLEDATAWEGTSVWLGKPAAVLISMHSVGGKGVLSRLQGVLSTLGLLIPPMSGMVYSAANHLALRAESGEITEDLWNLEDLEVIAHNFLAALETRPAWKAWKMHTGDPHLRWL